MRFGRALVAGAFVVGAVLPGPAYADSLLRADAVGDVARSPVGSNVYSPAPSRVEGDITTIRVRHGRRTIVVGVKLRELTTTTNGNFHRFTLKSDRRIRTIAIDAYPGHWDGRAVIRNPRGDVLGCAIRHRIDYVRNTVTLRVPRACLGRHPRWVRAGAQSTIAGTTYAYADDAGARGYVASPVLGPRVHR